MVSANEQALIDQINKLKAEQAANRARFRIKAEAGTSTGADRRGLADTNERLQVRIGELSAARRLANKPGVTEQNLFAFAEDRASGTISRGEAKKQKVEKVAGDLSSIPKFENRQKARDRARELVSGSPFSRAEGRSLGITPEPISALSVSLSSVSSQSLAPVSQQSIISRGGGLSNFNIGTDFGSAFNIPQVKDFFGGLKDSFKDTFSNLEPIDETTTTFFERRRGRREKRETKDTPFLPPPIFELPTPPEPPGSFKVPENSVFAGGSGGSKGKSKDKPKKPTQFSTPAIPHTPIPSEDISPPLPEKEGFNIDFSKPTLSEIADERARKTLESEFGGLSLGELTTKANQPGSGVSIAPFTPIGGGSVFTFRPTAEQSSQAIFQARRDIFKEDPLGSLGGLGRDLGIGAAKTISSVGAFEATRTAFPSGFVATLSEGEVPSFFRAPTLDFAIETADPFPDRSAPLGQIATGIAGGAALGVRGLKDIGALRAQGLTFSEIGAEISGGLSPIKVAPPRKVTPDFTVRGGGGIEVDRFVISPKSEIVRIKGTSGNTLDSFSSLELVSKTPGGSFSRGVQASEGLSGRITQSGGLDFQKDFQLSNVFGVQTSPKSFKTTALGPSEPISLADLPGLNTQEALIRELGGGPRIRRDITLPESGTFKTGESPLISTTERFTTKGLKSFDIKLGGDLITTRGLGGEFSLGIPLQTEAGVLEESFIAGTTKAKQPGGVLVSTKFTPEFTGTQRTFKIGATVDDTSLVSFKGTGRKTSLDTTFPKTTQLNFQQTTQQFDRPTVNINLPKIDQEFVRVQNLPKIVGGGGKGQSFFSNVQGFENVQGGFSSLSGGALTINPPRIDGGTIQSPIRNFGNLDKELIPVINVPNLKGSFANLELEKGRTGFIDFNTFATKTNTRLIQDEIVIPKVIQEEETLQIGEEVLKNKNTPPPIIRPRPRTPSGRLFPPPFIIPGLGFSQGRTKRIKGKRTFTRRPSLAAFSLGITSEKPVLGEQTGLIIRPLIKPKKKRKKKKK